MNQSLLIMADFAPQIKKNTQSIGVQDIDIEKLFKTALNSDPTIYLCVHPEIKYYMKEIISSVRLIRAAGGLVKNGKGEFLFIHRLGRWDLPKGKVEEDEKMRAAAVREVEEECGIKIDYLGSKIATTYHTYTIKGKLVLKQTKWYDMGVNESPKLIPQAEEDITDAVWLPKKELKQVRDNTYPMINELLDTI